MLTFKRALVAAAFFITVLFLVTRTSTPSALDSLSASAPKPPPSPPVPASPAFPQHKAGDTPDSARQPSTTAATLKTPSEGAAKTPIKNGAQRPMAQAGDGSSGTTASKMSLFDRLAYQFPYDVESRFPAYIWQTWKYTPAQGEFEFRDQEASWSVQHPGFIHEVITDSVAVAMLQLFYASMPEVQEAYAALPLAVLRADFFRYLILLARGGVYSDIDTYAIRSAVEWLPESVELNTVGLVIGIEADPDRPDWADWYSRRVQFCQWTIQSKPGHPVLREIVARITAETLRRKKAGLLKNVQDKNVIEFTGPALWTDVVFEYFNDERFFDMSASKGAIDWRNFTGMAAAKKVGDVVVLPITSFSPGVKQMGAGEYDDAMAFVKHDFEGTWKPENERHIGVTDGDD